MSATKRIATCFLVLCAVQFVTASHGQDFSAPSRYTSNWYANDGYTANARAGYEQRRVNPAYTAPREFANRSASYWVERDARYMRSLPGKQQSPYVSPVTSYRPPYAQTAACASGGCSTGAIYRGQGPAAYHRPAAYSPAAYTPTLPSSYGYGGYTPSRPAKPAYSPHRVPEGYYRGDGIFGKDTVFAANQPVRNFFRYLMP